MNLYKDHRADELFDAMPPDLQERYMQANPRDTNGNELVQWDDYINHSFTWGDTKEGHSFWSDVHAMGDFSEYEAICMRELPRTIRQHLDSIGTTFRDILIAELIGNKTPEQRAEFYANYEQGKESTILSRSLSWREFIDMQSGCDFSREFWKAVRDAKSYAEADRIAEEQMQEVEIYGGGTARRCELIKLNSEVYGDNAYSKKDLVTDSRNGVILKTDLVEYYDRDTDKRRAHKNILDETIQSNGLTFPFIVFCERHQTYIESRIAFRYGIGINYKTGAPEKIYLSTYSIIQTRHFKFTAPNEEIEADADFVKVHHKTYEYKTFMNKNNSSVYVDIVTGQYFCEDIDPSSEYVFYEAQGAQKQVVKISSSVQVPPTFEHHGQRFAPVETNTEGSYQTRRFFSRQSAENAGLTLSVCPHCHGLHSQYHDQEQCMRDNFKNERFGYHSQKPRYISSRSEFKIGVEIEKESFAGASHSHRDIFRAFGWVKESDSSLDGRIGYELVSPAFGLFGNNLIKEAEKLEAKFPSLINGEASNACGGHIHFSRANTSGEETLEMHCGYLPLLYAIYKGRTKATYCKGKEKEELKHSRDKYQAVRVLDNRIEFRIFPAVKNVKTLAWRIELLRYMAKNPTASPVQVVNDLCDKRTKLHKLFLQIFSEKTIYNRAIDTLNMATKYDRNYYNIDFSKERTAIAKKAVKAEKK